MFNARKVLCLKRINQFRVASEFVKQNQCKTYYTYSPEPSQPLNRDPTICSIEDAVKCVKSGKLFFILQL